MDLIITIDTEADNQWTRLKTFTTENARYIPRFQGLCDQFGFKPTYLCTYEMVTDFCCREILGPYQESGRAEIGAHLHPWSNPPFAPELGDWPEHHTFPHELPIDLFEQKMVVLTEAIRQTFGRSPTSYRAGRYGFHASHANVLLHLGYFVDCSVTPYLSWKTATGIPGGIGGADFREARPGASILGWKENGSREMADGLLEAPITILFTRWPLRSWPRGQTWWTDNQKGIPARLLHKLGYGPTWFRPRRDTTARQLISVYREAKRLGLQHVIMMLHSSELMPGCSKNFPDEASIEALYKVLEAVFGYIAADGGRSVILSDFAHRYLCTC